jgi:hypothetical protein
MGEAGRRLVDPAFRAERMVQQIARVYEQLIANSRRGTLRRAFRYRVPSAEPVVTTHETLV